MGGFLSSLIFQPPRRSSSRPVLPRMRMIPSGRSGEREICTFFCDIGAPVTVLFSHGNAEDIEMLLPFFVNELCPKVGVNALLYDYACYGHSDRTTLSQEAIFDDARAAYRHLTETLRKDPRNIVLFGRSLGACVTTHLASELDDPILGVILQAPMLSIYRIALRLRFSLPGDALCNIDKVQRIQRPVMIIHGVKDEVIPFWHGVALNDKLVYRVPALFLEAQHNDVEVLFGSAVFCALREFFQVARAFDRCDACDCASDVPHTQQCRQKALDRAFSAITRISCHNGYVSRDTLDNSYDQHYLGSSGDEEARVATPNSVSALLRDEEAQDSPRTQARPVLLGYDTGVEFG
ncbi:MAG: hypothetical protein MHM6MM_000502 [Cercozoa sp. M6MM]